jgi:co-chaperonin GroES (HSP10)
MFSVPPPMVAIKPIMDPDKTESGLLYIPEIAKERADQGIVTYVGSKVKYVEPGDYVIFSGYSGSLIYLAGEGHFIIMHERLIMAVVDDGDWEATLIPGVFITGKDGNFIPATLEVMSTLMAETVRKNRKIKYASKEEKILSRNPEDAKVIDWTADE